MTARLTRIRERPRHGSIAWKRRQLSRILVRRGIRRGWDMTDYDALPENPITLMHARETLWRQAAAAVENTSTTQKVLH